MRGEVTDAMLVEALRAGRRVRFVARGSSMWPAVRDGSTVEVTACGAEALRVGDLGVFVRRGGLVVHRVLRREGAGWRCAGDARWRDDGVVSDGEVLGRARVVMAPPWYRGRPTAGLVLRALYGQVRRGVERARGLVATRPG